MQIDVIEIKDNGFVSCNLYTGDRCVRMYMLQRDYEDLVRDRFFIRDGKTKDSANVLNTTRDYVVNENDKLF